MASSELRAKLELLAGEPELVVVDARALRLLLGGVADLIILERFDRGGMRRQFVEDEGFRYVWDEDDLCP